LCPPPHFLPTANAGCVVVVTNVPPTTSIVAIKIADTPRVLVVVVPTGGGLGSIQAILGNNSTSAATAILPIISKLANFGIPLTGNTAIGFTLGIIKG
jgi:hypothetical protein